MSNIYIQAGRPLTIRTLLGENAFLVVGVEGREAISELYRAEVDLVAESDNPVEFDLLLGQEATLTLGGDTENPRYFSGIVCAMEQGETTTAVKEGRQQDYTRYRMSIVPKLWLLSRQQSSRIFQRRSVLEILQTLFLGLDASYETQAKYEPRDYCVQYRETDLNFALRLMEEEGIFFFFRHTESGHTMVVTDSPQSHSELSGKFLFEPLNPMTDRIDRIFSWRRTQEIRSGKCTLWDHCFEMPDKNLAVDKEAQPKVTVGAAELNLNAAGVAAMEIYDYPGGFASRFDGINKSGGDQASELQKVFEDNQRTVGLRMQAETALAVRISGRSAAFQFCAGAKFELSRHFSDNGPFVITSVTHRSRQSIATSPLDSPFEYENEFTCIPFALPFRPQRVTRVPFVQGTHTAVVVGPAGEEIFTDKYGRVKVQFHWDREGQLDIDSSCWVRVASSWAGKAWGAVHIPRVGQEVVVAFEEGDPNQPIIIGSVYNANNMPPYSLPDHKTQSGIKSRSTPNGTGYNELRFEDEKGGEQIVVHAERDLLTTVGNDRTTTITENDSTTLERGDQTTKIKLGKSETAAMESIELKVGQSSILLDQKGVTIKGLRIQIEGTVQVEVSGLTTEVKGECLLTAKGGMVMIN
jgi:type VI secretion system secreted protein VgrG